MHRMSASASDFVVSQREGITFLTLVNTYKLLFYAETAVNIGFSCKMLTEDMTEVFTISGHTVQSVRQQLRSVCLCLIVSAVYDILTINQAILVAIL